MTINPGVEQRVTVERIGMFNDVLAFGDWRGIYVIYDSKTGREYIGVSGIGIAETGSHSDGNDSVRDER